MKNMILFVLLFLLIPSKCKKDDTGPVDIPDENFLKALIKQGVDTDEDSIISTIEAKAINLLDVSDQGISDMTGIEAFVNLGGLKCKGNQLTTLDVSNCKALKVLACHNNQLTTLDVSNCKALESLVCVFNQLTTLDVSNCKALTQLICSFNQLTTLDISNNTSMYELYVHEMPTLHQVCVWTMPFPPDGVNVYIDGSPNVYYTTECSE